HRDLDYLDNHFYVDHYNFPNVAWDARDWRIRDSSAVGSGLQALSNMALARAFGRPYTVSEYNQPWPNRQGAEIDPTVAAFAALQDWDGVVHFAYEHSRTWDAGVPHGFNLNGDWGKWVNFGQAAWLFRSGVLEAARERIELPVSEQDRLRAGREKRNSAIAAFLTSLAGFDPAVCFLHACGLRTGADNEWPENARNPGEPPYVSDTGQLVYDLRARRLLIRADRAAGIIGYVEGIAASGPIAFELAPDSRNFLTLLVTSLDDRPLDQSERLLVSLPGATLRSQPGTAPPRSQQLINYPGSMDWFTLEPDAPNKPSGNLNAGAAPVWMERVEGVLSLRTRAARLTVYPLDGAGRRLEPLDDRWVCPGEGGFRIHLQAEGQPLTPWYEIVAEF
ncbi:MAG: hypothetical protein ACPL88_09565, partial [Bryobacteraceae bacterium]